LKKTKKVKKRKILVWGWRTSVPKLFLQIRRKLIGYENLFLFTSKTNLPNSHPLKEGKEA
jgi:hypothetical protein